MLSRPDYMFKKIIIVFLNQGEKIRIQNDNLIVENKEREIKLQSSCYRIFSLWIIGSLTLTNDVLQKARKHGFSVVLFTHSFRVSAVLCVPLEGNTLLHKQQYQFSQELELAKHIIKNKTDNQIRALKKARQNGDWAKEVIQQLAGYKIAVQNCLNLSSLLGLEGSAAKTYFSQIFAEHQWSGRKPRVKHDINNCLLDIGYTLLFSFVEALLRCYDFDLYVGFYHKIFYKRKSLVCDLEEPFRCIIDYQLRKMRGLNMIHEGDFQLYNHQYQLSYKHSKHYIQHLLAAILEYREEIFLYIQQYYRCFSQGKEIDQYPTFTYT